MSQSFTLPALFSIFSGVIIKRRLANKKIRPINREMDNLLILLGVLGFGAVIISIHVFAQASRTYQLDRTRVADDGELDAGYKERRPGDRRSGELIVFPLIVGGTLIHEDRRTLPDRRMVAA